MLTTLYQILRHKQAKAFATLAVMSFFLAANTVEAKIEHPALIAAPHCRAFVLALTHDDTDIIPDMGFIIGARWQALTLKERSDISRMIISFIGRASNTPLLPELFKGCALNFNISLLPHDTESSMNMHDLPRLHSYRATAQAVFLVSSSDTPMAITYILEKDQGYIWEIQEVIVDKTPLAAHYSGEFNNILSQQGTTGLLKHLNNAK